MEQYYKDKQLRSESYVIENTIFSEDGVGKCLWL